MIQPKSQAVINAFFGNKEAENIESFGNGHIHDTYLLKIEGTKERFILQKLNNSVFPDCELLTRNHIVLQDHLYRSANDNYRIPAILPTIQDPSKFLFYDTDGFPWRLMEFVENSYSVDKMESPDMAYEAGKAYGWFLVSSSTLAFESITISIPKFHDLKFRIDQLDEAIKKDKANRKTNSKSTIDFFKARESEFLELIDLVEQGLIPTRITHNDTKINNVLFRNSKAIAVIDLDTIGPGIIHYDYGDSLRTIANLSTEDEQDHDKVGLNKAAFLSFTKGYLEKAVSILTPFEVQHLHMAPRLMTYIIGIRFLTDYLNGDVYFKTKYKEHNLVRTQVQQKLIESMEIHDEYMKTTIKQIIENKKR